MLAAEVRRKAGTAALTAAGRAACGFKLACILLRRAAQEASYIFRMAGYILRQFSKKSFKWSKTAAQKAKTSAGSAARTAVYAAQNGALKKAAAAAVLVTAAFAGITFMTLNGTVKQQNTQAEAVYVSNTPGAGLSTETLIAAISADDISVDFVIVSSVAQEDTRQFAQAIETLSASVAEIESCVEAAYESASAYSEADEAYQASVSILSEAAASLAAAEESGTYALASLYISEMESLVEEAQAASEEAAEEAAAAKAAEEAAAAKAAQEAADAVADTSDAAELRQALVDYALSFVGVTPYKYGGTSLTSGVDCSGFTQAIYAAFGYSLPHSSYSQRSCGTSVSLSDIKIGDIVCYSGHVAIYIGNGQVVHAPGSGEYVSIGSLYMMSIKSIRRIIQ